MKENRNLLGFRDMQIEKTLKATENDQKFEYRWISASSRGTENTIKALLASVQEKVYLRSQMKLKKIKFYNKNTLNLLSNKKESSKFIVSF
jgi:hypothetical protein